MKEILKGISVAFTFRFIKELDAEELRAIGIGIGIVLWILIVALTTTLIRAMVTK